MLRLQFHQERTADGGTTVCAMDPASDCIAEIISAWSRGAAHTMDLAKVVLDARRRLRYGEWSKLWQSRKIPFSKRKGEMLVALGERLNWLDAQTFAHLPTGWSILYQLAQLERAVFRKLLGEQVIHPKLTLREARELVAGLNRCQKKSAGINVRRRLCQFSDFVERTLNQWKPEERKLAKIELTGLIERIGEVERKAVARRCERLIVAFPAVTAEPIHQTQGRL